MSELSRYLLELQRWNLRGDAASRHSAKWEFFKYWPEKFLARGLEEAPLPSAAGCIGFTGHIGPLFLSHTGRLAVRSDR